MKKLIIFAAAALMMAGCGQKTAKGGDNDTTATAGITAAEASEDVRMEPLKTDTVFFDKQEGIYKFGLSAEYPVSGGDSVVKAVREFINDFLGGAYDGPLADGKAMVKRNGELMWGNFLEMCGDADTEEVNELFLYKMVNKVYETKTFVTFQASVSQYTGGIHGIGFESGHTFSKINGKRFGYDMMKDLDTPQFKRLVKEGLRKYFSDEGDGQAMSDESLKQELVSFDGDINDLPLPDYEPYMTEQGVTFIYQPYEISYYAAGKPEFTIPYDVVKPYLTAQAIELF
jgi:hypothetical protein